MKELRRDIGDVEQRVDKLKQMQVAREQEVDGHRRELITLQEQNLELQHQLEDPANRSRRSYICIKEVLLRAVTGSLEYFLTRLFRHVAPTLKDQDTALD
ncbi:hypothetical protein NDU88_004239 [Pleurodeles waltl]|uniref:Uncharacterized protein n=1 Tax=Pleurodeles waltl TaxID=8319 RepID=A0AAV7L0W6_PLEWA|nr:hypothetical protein NDU88_004239 [Pleurodeles waltl]